MNFIEWYFFIGMLMAGYTLGITAERRAEQKTEGGPWFFFNGLLAFGISFIGWPILVLAMTII